MSRIFACLGPLLALVVATCLAATGDGSGKTDVQLERGARIYARACAACHGRDGKGDGPQAHELDPPARNLTLNQFRFRTTPTGTRPRPEDLERSIRQGLPGTSMPAYVDLLSDREMADVIAFIYSLLPGGYEEPPEAISMPEIPPTADAATLDEGHSVYLLLECWRCHGMNLAGHGPAAKTLEDDNEDPIRTPDFRHEPLKGGPELGIYIRSLLTGMNGAPMPSYAETLLFGREDYAERPALEGRLTAEEEANLEAYLAAEPSREELALLDPAGQAALRDARLAAVAHYTFSLQRRRGFWSWLLHQEPELEGREP